MLIWLILACSTAEPSAADAPVAAPPAPVPASALAAEAEQSPADGLTEAPYTEAQLRASMTVGTRARYVVSSGGLSEGLQWEVVAADDVGYTLSVIRTDLGGAPKAAPETQTTTWAQHRANSRYPVDEAVGGTERIELPWGPVDAIRWRAPLDVQGPDLVGTFWFDPAVPGLPVRFVTEVDGVEFTRMELVEWTRP